MFQSSNNATLPPLIYQCEVEIYFQNTNMGHFKDILTFYKKKKKKKKKKRTK